MEHLYKGTRRRQSNIKEARQVKKIIDVPGVQINGPSSGEILLSSVPTVPSATLSRRLISHVMQKSSECKYHTVSFN